MDPVVYESPAARGVCLHSVVKPGRALRVWRIELVCMFVQGDE